MKPTPCFRRGKLVPANAGSGFESGFAAHQATEWIYKSLPYAGR